MGILKYYKEFYKRHSLRIILLSIVCLIMFFLAIIPAKVVLPSGTSWFLQNNVGGIQTERTDA